MAFRLFLLLPAFAVGHDEHPVPPVGCSDLPGSHKTPFRIVPERGQVTKDFLEGPSSIGRKETWGILNEDVARSNHAKHLGELGPEPPLILLAPPSAGKGDWLTGKASANKVNWFEVLGVELGDVSIACHLRPMVLENPDAVLVHLDLPFDGEPGAFQAQIKSADPRKQRTHCQHGDASPPATRSPSNSPGPYVGGGGGGGGVRSWM